MTNTTTSIEPTEIIAPEKRRGGRPRGSKNRRTQVLADAILRAAKLCGDDYAREQGEVGSQGRPLKGGLVGYLRHQAKQHPELFVPALLKLLPKQIETDIAATITPFLTKPVTEMSDEELQTFILESKQAMLTSGGARKWMR